MKDLLAAGAAITPNVPITAQALLGSAATNLRGRDAFVFTIVPLANVLGNLDSGAALVPTRWCATVHSPGEWASLVEVEQLKGALGAAPGRDIAGAGGRISGGIDDD